jgi:protein-tyrosine phosphatase
VPSILVVCVGNICRSPVAEGLLRRDVAGAAVASAGLHAVVGHGTQGEMLALARGSALTCQPTGPGSSAQRWAQGTT